MTGLNEKLLVEEADLLQRPEVVKAVEMAEALRAHCAEHNLLDGIFAGVVIDGDGFAQHYHDTGFQHAIDWLVEAQKMSKAALNATGGEPDDTAPVDTPDDVDDGTTDGGAVASGQDNDTGDDVSEGSVAVDGVSTNEGAVDLDGMVEADASNAAAVNDANG